MFQNIEQFILMILAVTVNCFITVPLLHVHVSVELGQQFRNVFLRVLVVFQISSFRLLDLKCFFFLLILEVIALQTSLNSTQLLLALQVQRQQTMIYWTCLETPLPLFPAVVIWVIQLWATWICLGWTSPWWA